MKHRIVISDHTRARVQRFVVQDRQIRNVEVVHQHIHAVTLPVRELAAARRESQQISYELVSQKVAV